MTSNAINPFINGNETRPFEYEGGEALYTWCPYSYNLSTTLECNIIFFADNLEHARQVLIRAFEHVINANNDYDKTVDPERRHAAEFKSRNARQTERCLGYIEAINSGKADPTLAPRTQILKTAWAANDTIF